MKYFSREIELVYINSGFSPSKVVDSSLFFFPIILRLWDVPYA